MNVCARGGSSKFKGVTCDKKRPHQWRALIRKNYKLHHLGRFGTEKEAAMAYNKAAKKLFGSFALLNAVG